MKLIVDADSVREFASRKTGQVFRKQTGGLLKEGQRVPAAVEWWVRNEGDAMPPGEYAVQESWIRVNNGALEFQPMLPAKQAAKAA